MVLSLASEGHDTTCYCSDVVSITKRYFTSLPSVRSWYFVECVACDQLDFTAGWASASQGLPGRRRRSSGWLRNEAVTENSLPANRLQSDLWPMKTSRALAFGQQRRIIIKVD